MRCSSVSVGIVDYAHPFYSESAMRLRYAVGDARAFHRYVSLAWPSEDRNQHHLLRDREADIVRLEAAVADIGANGSLDLFFLYLSGHGELGTDGSGWFCLADAQPSQPSLHGAAIDHCLAAIDADCVIVIVDCCHAEAVVASSRSFSLRKGRRARVVAASCRADQRAWEDDGLQRSIFSDILLRALSTDSPLADTSGQVDLEADLLPYLRNQVPITAAAKKRGRSQDPVTAGFLSGSLTLPVMSSRSLGRPLTIPQAIRAGVRRFLMAGFIAFIAALAAIDLMIFHLAVDSTGEVLVRPGFAATYAFMPIHLVGNLDTGVSIRDMNSRDDSMMAALAAGSIWGIATHRDTSGLKPWLAALEPGLVDATRESLRALAFGDSPKFDVDEDPPPTVQTLFLAMLRGESPSETGRALYSYDAVLPWACTERVSNRFDFTRLLAGPEVFARDMGWIAATGSVRPVARAEDLANLVKLAAYRALSEQDGEQQLAEFDAFAEAVEQIAHPSLIDGLGAAAAPFLRSAKGTWCALHASFAAAITGDAQNSSAAEAELRAVLKTYDRSRQGDGGSAEQMMAVHGLARLTRYRPLDPATLRALYQMIKRDDADLTAVTPATELLTEIAARQKLSPELEALLLENLRPEMGVADFAPLTAANLLARNAPFLDSGPKTRLREWLSAAAPAKAFVGDFHEAIGFLALTEPIARDLLALLQERLSSTSRFPPQATNYRGEMVITSSGDMAAIALGRVAQSTMLETDIAERLANLAAARTDIEGREEIVRGLAAQWFGAAPDLTAAVCERLAATRADASRRVLEIEVARSALVQLQSPTRTEVLNRLLAVWRAEVEPIQRIALGTLIGSAVID
jgi:hypothetical protein